MNRFSTFLGLAVLLLGSPALAEVPTFMQFQGYVTDTEGVPLSGEYGFVFTMYGSSEGEDFVWTDMQAVTVTQGHFVALLGGEMNPLGSAVFTGAPLWLGVTIGEGSELAPRSVIGSVPYAARANVATDVVGDINPSSVSVGGMLVIDETGKWVGASTGLVGPQGIPGEKGDKGDEGDIGPVGPQGLEGDTGDAGPMGPQGLKGDTGDTGPMGPQGLKGDTGDVGPMGPQGLKGDTGDVGPMGPQGLKGDTGEKGAAGVHCWDASEDGVCDVIPEDKNGDGACDVGDCYSAAYQDLLSDGRLDNNDDSDVLLRWQADLRYYTQGVADATFAPILHMHDDRYYTEAEMDAALAGKAAAVHGHNDLYYTEAEMNTALAGKAASVHTHDDRYYTEGESDARYSLATHNHSGVYSPTSHNHDTTYWKVGGNAGTDPATAYIGTSDNQAVVVRANGSKLLSLQPLKAVNQFSGANIVGGYYDNYFITDAVGTVTLGGGYYTGVSYPNIVADHWGAVLGGMNNIAGAIDDSVHDSLGAAVVGGANNAAGGAWSFVGGGNTNAASGRGSVVVGGASNSASGWGDFVGGGDENDASGGYSVVVGGRTNSSSGLRDFVGGGYLNESDGPHATICGGYDNLATGERAFIGGGNSNSAGGMYSVVAGGNDNSASGESSCVAGGYSATASGMYAFVGGGYDNTAGGRGSVAMGRMANVSVNGTICLADWGTTDAGEAAAFGCNDANQFQARFRGGYDFYTNMSGAGAYLGPNQTAWAAMSDRNKKENFTPVDAVAVLECLLAMPVSTWTYIFDETQTLHMGPMAQDMYACYGLGESDKTISTLDADGVLFAAVQGLDQKFEERFGVCQQMEEEVLVLSDQIQVLTEKNQALTAQVQALGSENSALKARLDRIEGALGMR